MKQKKYYPDIIDMMTNIFSLHDHLLQNHHDKAKYWYYDHHDLLKSAAENHGVKFSVMVGIVAVLSPNVNWNRNVIDAENLITGKGSITAYKTNVNKAKLMLKNDSVTPFLSGAKVTAFYDNLLDPMNSDYVTIDSHAVKIAIGKNHKTDYAYRFLNGLDRREKVIEAYIKSSLILGYKKPHELQAVLWDYVVNHNGYDAMGDHNVY